jgi:hypothetical protein
MAAKSIFILTVVSGASTLLSVKRCATMSTGISMIFHDTARWTPFLAKSPHPHPHPRPSRCTSRVAKRLNRKILTTSLSSLLHTVEAGLVDKCKLFSDVLSHPLWLLDASEILRVVKGPAERWSKALSLTWADTCLCGRTCNGSSPSRDPTWHSAPSPAIILYGMASSGCPAPRVVHVHDGGPRSSRAAQRSSRATWATRTARPFL